MIEGKRPGSTGSRWSRAGHCSGIKRSNSKPSSNRGSSTGDGKLGDGGNKIRKVAKRWRRSGEDEGAREGGVRKGGFNE